MSALLMAKLSRRVAKILRKMFMRKKLKISSIVEERWGSGLGCWGGGEGRESDGGDIGGCVMTGDGGG